MHDSSTHEHTAAIPALYDAPQHCSVDGRKSEDPLLPEQLLAANDYKERELFGFNGLNPGKLLRSKK